MAGVRKVVDCQPIAAKGGKITCYIIKYSDGSTRTSPIPVPVARMPRMCGISDRTIAECNPPIEPHSDPEKCGICGRRVA